MKRLMFSLRRCADSGLSSPAETTLPAWETQAETAQRESGQITGVPTRGIETRLSTTPCATWPRRRSKPQHRLISYPSILGKVAAAQPECEVIILTENVNTETYLLGASGPGNIIDNLDNITLIEVDEVDSVDARLRGVLLTPLKTT